MAGGVSGEEVNHMSDSEFELTNELASFIEALHDSEINGEIGGFFDGVWRAKIGDPWNGYRAEAEAANAILEAAARGGKADHMTDRSTRADLR